MFGLGMSEIFFLAILALIVIGPKELPEVARTLGRFINELKRSTSVLGDELKQQVRIDPVDLNKNRPHPEANSDLEPADTYNHQSHNEYKEETASVDGEQLELVDQNSSQDKKEGQRPS